MLVGRLSILGLAVALTIVGVLVAVENNPLQASLGVFYVAPGGNCGGASPCYGTVQAAVDAAQAGDEIRVAGGDYFDVNEYSGLSQVVYITKTVTVRGGYTTANWNVSDPEANPTNLNAMVAGRVIYISGEGITVTLDGLHVSYGNANGLGGAANGSDVGGGIYVLNANVIIRNSWVMSSTAPNSGAGGGMYMRDNTATVTGSVFQGNSAGNGGGVYLDDSDGLFENNQVLDNKVTFSIGLGTGMYVGSSAITLRGNTFRGNSNTQAPWSAALKIYFGNVQVIANLIENNTNTDGLDGSSDTIPGTLLVDGNTIRGNSGRGVQIRRGVYLTLTNNIIEYNNSGGVAIIYEAYPARAYVFGNWIHHNIKHGWGDCGGGLYATSGLDMPIEIVGNTIQDNQNGSGTTSGGSGGGVCLKGDTITMTRNIVQRNYANNVMTTHGYGGGIYMEGDALLTNNTVTDNSAALSGGGIAIRGASPTLYHNTIANNVGIGVYVAEGSGDQPAQPELYNTIIAGHDTGLYVSGEALNVARLDGILWWNNMTNKGGSGTAFVFNVLTGDPVFVDPVNGDFHIAAISAAIDHGIDAGVAQDCDGEPRFGVPDLGADEYWPPGVLRRLYLPMIRR